MTNLRSTYGVAMAMAERATKIGEDEGDQLEEEEAVEGEGEGYEEQAAVDNAESSSSIPLPGLDDPIAVTTQMQAHPVATDEFHYVDTLPIERAREFDF